MSEWYMRPNYGSLDGQMCWVTSCYNQNQTSMASQSKSKSVLSYGGDLPLQLPRVLKGFLHKIFIVPVEVYPGCCDKYGSLLMRS